PAKEEQPEPARREQPEPPLQSAREEHPGPALLPARGVPEPAPPAGRSRSRIPSIIVTLVIAAVACLSIWYLVRPEPLLVQGEVDATRLDIAARVDGRVEDIPVARGQDVK